jgi:hypothetical protein
MLDVSVDFLKQPVGFITRLPCRRYLEQLLYVVLR